MKKYILILFMALYFVSHSQSDTLQNPEGYITPVIEKGCESCFHPIILENYCHQILKNSVRVYDLRGREFRKEKDIPVGTIYIKTGIMRTITRKDYPFMIKVIKTNQ